MAAAQRRAPSRPARSPSRIAPFVVQVATEHFAGRGGARPKRQPPRGTTWRSCTIPTSRSRRRTRRRSSKFVKAAESLGCDAELISRDDYGRHRRVRRAVHPRDDGGQPPHLPLRPPRRERRAGGHRRSRVDRQAAPTRSTWPSCSTATRCRRRKTLVVHADNVDSDRPRAGLPVRAQEARQRVLAGRRQGRRREASWHEQLEALPRRVRPGRRPGVPADDVRLADRHPRPPAAVRLQVLHGRRATGRSSSSDGAGENELRQVRDAAGRARAAAGGARWPSRRPT